MIIFFLLHKFFFNDNSFSRQFRLLSSAQRKITLGEILSCCTSEEISYIDQKLPGIYILSCCTSEEISYIDQKLPGIYILSWSTSEEISYIDQK